jgi:hypothetical protein
MPDQKKKLKENVTDLKENSDDDTSDKENPTDIGPGVTERYRDA